MCLLNGEVGGSLESSVDFGTIEEENSQGIWEIRKLPLQEIIKNAVHVYAKEPYHNIIINDLDTYGLELLEYRYDIPLFLYREEGRLTYENAILKGDSNYGEVYKKENDTYTKVLNSTKLSEIENKYFESLVDELIVSDYYVIKMNNTFYRVAKIEVG
jgi:hypothetical protein